MFMPTEEQIREKAAEIGLLPNGGDLPPHHRKKVAQLLINEQQEAAQPQPRTSTTKNLLSRQVVAHGDSHLIFEVWEQKETAQ